MQTNNYNYNADTRQLIFISKAGKPVFGISGPIAERVYQKINFINEKPVIMTKLQLENKVTELNNWLMENENTKHIHYSQKQQNRNFYVRKLIELEESNLEMIRVL
ncbi:conserved hypothetical protein [Flavobacterium psychrophilum]|uniref:hypothetical protein n=1 Tax=Flavobacterium psychrophilum TaxID=96345 RepID=UPI000B7C213E|nr:hypothetical protein [Flavobacterium psychrophilum]SNA83208.1 conserved hypothetical protein [Flavobacterium psychrophilum]